MSAIKMYRWSAAAAVAVSLCAGSASAAEQPQPWRLDTALSAPDWLQLGGSYRVRYETLDNSFRANAPSGSTDILVERLLLNARLGSDRFYGDVELEDSRQQLADTGTPLGTDSVNTLEPLQAYLGMRFSDALTQGDHLDVQLGHMTIDNGGRRLVARNRFRNTLNAFTGVHATWQGSGPEVQVMFVEPVQRQPADRASLKDNDHELDTDSGDVRLWGVFTSWPNLFGKVTGEAYFYGFRARDHVGIPAADRDLYTPGVRFYSKPAKGAWDLEVEGAYQFGTSRATTAASDTRDLQQRAGFVHGEIGYTWKAHLVPRLEFSYDYASGDSDPTDNQNNRFDTLYGARRSDFGPTGIYGAIARGNISTPGLRLQIRPSAALTAMTGYRAVWLASDRDQYTTAKLQDASGASGSFVGNQLEAQLQYNLLPGNLALELGGAYLMQGHFLQHAPNAPDNGDTTYVYAAATFTF